MSGPPAGMSDPLGHERLAGMSAPLAGMSAPLAGLGRAWPGVVRAGSVLAVAGLAHGLVNARLLRVPPTGAAAVEPVSVLLPLRDEAHRVRPCLQALLVALAGLPDVELLVLDDASTDGTAELVRGVLTTSEAAGTTPSIRLLHSDGPPAGWRGKPAACAALAAAARPSSTVLVFLDADVVLAPDALTRTVACLRANDLQLVSPYPRQLAMTRAERLVQPLLQWSWLTLLPLRLAEQSPRPSLAAANGQLLAVDRACYLRAGGHGAVRDRILDDVALLRAMKAAGGHGGVVDGTDLATCRMYDGWPTLRDGYAKSLAEAGGSPAGSLLQVGLLLLGWVVPPLGLLTRSTRAAAALGTAVGVGSRVVAARRTGGRVVDAWQHPASVLTLSALTARSWRRRGTVTWKGRTLTWAPSWAPTR